VLASAGGPQQALARSGPVQLGTAVNTTGFLADPDPRYRGTLERYDAVTAESAMKIGDLEPQEDRWQFGPADAIVDFAVEHGQEVHGHTLTWCEDTWIPSWLRDRSWTRTALLGELESYIDTVLTHFHGRVASWDVVNEAFNADGTMRDCLWYRVIGPDWVEQAFRFAHDADPSVKLFYNEIRAEVPNPKFDAVIEMLRDFRAREVPIDGVGEEMHFVTGAPPRAMMETVIRSLDEIGLAVHISELDVPTWYLGSNVAEKLARQAQSYRDVGAACQGQPACFRITTWGFSDRYTWRGANSMPLPFDTEYRPKPAWAALLEALNPAPAPPPSPASVPPPAPAPAVALPAAPPVTSSRARYRAWIDGSAGGGGRRARGARRVLFFQVSPATRVRYRVCLHSNLSPRLRCFRRRTGPAGSSKIDVTSLLNRAGGPARWRVVWRVSGHRVALRRFRVMKTG
jgi:endo-1,4-beta-xylanase